MVSTGRNVIDFTAHRAQLGPRELRQVEAYWEGLRNRRLLPDRSDVDPRGLSPVLRHCVLLEKVAPGHARLRIAGRHVSDLMGMDVEGMPLSALFLPDARAGLVETVSAVFEEPALARLELESPGALGRSKLGARMVLLPLRDDMGDVTRALGCIVAEGAIGRTPRRFFIASQERQTLVAYGRSNPFGLDPGPETAKQTGAEIVDLRPREY